MGIQWFAVSTKMMKSIVFAALVADADAYYGGYYGLGYSGLGYSGLGYRSYGYVARPYASTYGAYSYGAYPYHAIGKRSADAEPEADADAYYGGYYGLGVYGYSGLGAYGYSGLGYRSYGYAAAVPATYGAYSYGAYPYHAI